VNHNQVPPAAIAICRATDQELPIIGELARRIWRASFPGMITDEQIEYMLAQRYSPEAMREAAATGRLTYEVLRVDGEPLAFAAHGPREGSSEFKLQQLYVHPEWQGRGLGGYLLDHLESIAREQGRTSMVLTVNRRNQRARAVYERRGYSVRSEVEIEIGNGFVMDDYVMEKRLG
jgi:ribosomal protein S18 acetylase RimI-like enzyme